jgi:hypothetical protein
MSALASKGLMAGDTTEVPHSHPPLHDPTKQLAETPNHLSPATSLPPVPKSRVSYLDSAYQAEGIFDLYSEGEEHADPSYLQAGQTIREAPLLPEDGDIHEGAVEELDSPTSADSWSGPYSALRQPKAQDDYRFSTLSVDPPIGKSVDKDALPLPQVMITPDKSQSRQSNPTSMSTSTTMSISPSPTHPSIARLTPRVPSSTGVSASTRSSFSGTGVGNGSEVSFGSVQYPGEEDDSFHVRSTCGCLCWLGDKLSLWVYSADARLESEGVHGDGWDPGVERTRGGPASGKRATMFEAGIESDLGEKERDYLTHLDR